MNQVKVRVVAAVVSVFALGVTGCAGNQAGNVEATALGDTSHPAERGSPTQSLEEACGAQGALTTDATPRIKRAPYLQQLTSSSVIVGWLSKTGTEERVDVTRPDGSVVMTADGKDDTSVRQTGEKQMWSHRRRASSPTRSTATRSRRRRDGAHRAHRVSHRAGRRQRRGRFASSRSATRAAAAAISTRCSSRCTRSRTT